MAPTSYPVWLQKSGAPDMLVMEAMSYGNAVAQGYSYPSTVPVLVTQTGTGTVVIIEDAINVQQPDPGQQDQIS